MAQQKDDDQADQVEPVKRRLGKWPWIFAILAVLVVVIVVNTNRDGGDTATAPAPAPEQVAEPEPVGVGRPVRDGLFEFTVVGVEYSPSVGDQYVSETAQGQYATVTVRVANIGNEARSFADTDQYLFDADDRRYSTDLAAESLIPGNDVFYNPINPGNVVEGALVYDVPVDVEPTRIELHDSAFSQGVSVGLR
ncbi:DUF4352 domain-containing protein [Saccharomonospora azurea]|uniref:Telomeric repeat-binding factor 2 n=1 Tax=Saccharomonospora azurea NA-128 TaxID=882081 RepID=H8G9M2_9PSEU|nr:DUF4352 domain-containing protein [Saccharomonospora azurea]EHY89554.1 Telomeric repeat-binding factor 2 [Saccharomonospora azurea NA-128]